MEPLEKEVAFSNPHHMRISPRWCPPPPGDLKLTFDGSALSNPSLAGVMRDEDGITLRSYSGLT